MTVYVALAVSQDALIRSSSQLFPPAVVQAAAMGLAARGPVPVIAMATTGSDPVAERLQRRAFAMLDAWSVILPIRVANEELGDYLENIANRAAQGQRVLVWLRVTTAIFWTSLNAVGYALKQLRGKAT